MKKLVFIDGWMCNKQLPYKGKYKTDSGQSMFGFYKRVYKENEEVLVLNNGNVLGKYKYPRVESSFQSKMINWYNLCFCGGYWIKDIDGNEINTDENLLKRVIEGKKPVGFIMATENEVKAIAHKAKVNNLEVLINLDVFFDDGSEYLVEVGFANSGKLKEHFDIEAVIESYRFMSKKHGYVILSNDDEVRLRNIAEKELSFFLKDFDYANPTSNYECVLIGLILGFPVESTFSFITR